MSMYQDQFHNLLFTAPLFTSLNVTAAGKLGNVLDRRDLSDPDGDLIGFLVTANAVVTADATDFIKLVLWEADEKTDATTLTTGAIVNVGTGTQGEGSGSDSDVLGYTANGVRQVTVNPKYDATVTRTAQTELPNLQDGVFPLIDATALAGTVFYFAYRGYKNCLQVFAEKGPGAVNGTFSCLPVIASMKTRNPVNDAAA